MRYTTQATLVSRTEGIQLTKAELTILRRASVVAEAARKMARSYDSEFEQSDYDTLLGEIEHNVKDIEDGFIPIGETTYDFYGFRA